MVAGGACMVARGHVWLQGGTCVVVGGIHGCWEGMCCCQGGHAWLLGGVHGCWGACMVAKGGMYGCKGACVVAGGCAWLWGACIGYDEIRSMSGRYASYWNAFLFCMIFMKNCMKMTEIGREGGASLAPPLDQPIHSPKNAVHSPVFNSFRICDSDAGDEFPAERHTLYVVSVRR